MSSNPDRPPQTPVEYERPHSVAFARTLRVLLLVTLVNTILLALNLAGMKPWEFAHQVYKDWSKKREQAKASADRLDQAQAAEQECRTFLFPPDHVAYTEVPGEAMALLADGKRYNAVLSGEAPAGWQTPVISAPPDCLRRFSQLAPRARSAGATRLASPSSPLMGAVFLHERRAPSGEAVLIHAFIGAGHQVESENVHDSKTGMMRRTFSVRKTRALFAIAYPVSSASPREPWRYELELILPDSDPMKAAEVTMSRVTGRGVPDPPATQPLELLSGHQLRMLGGQADPNDSSHFLIAYELDGAPGTIDGWVVDNAVLLRPREGRLLPSSASPRWQLRP